MATTRKTTTASAAKASKATTRPTAPTEGAAPEGETAAAAVKQTLKIRELVNAVAEATGGKKKGLREIVEATLVAVGEALGRGEDLNLPGLGRTRVARSAEKDGASHMTLKVRRGAHKKKEHTEPLADEEDDG